MSGNIKETLVKAKQLVERGWVKMSFAIDDEGEPCSPMDENACGWCVSGAIQAASKYKGASYIQAEEKNLFENVRSVFMTTNGIVGFGSTIMAWNDQFDRTKEEVLAAFDKAINCLQRKQT